MKLIDELGLINAKRILDYTHAKQNINGCNMKK